MSFVVTGARPAMTRMAEWIGRESLVRNLGWYGLAEAVARVSRLGVTIILARTMSSWELGLAATAITCFELVRVLGNAGLGELIIRASREQLAATCETVHRLGWMLCLAMTTAQLAVGGGLALFGGGAELVAMTLCLAGVFLVMPCGLVPAYLLRRDARLREVALIGCAQAVADSVLTVVLALSGAGAWAIVLPKLLTAPLWLLAVRRCRVWTRGSARDALPIREVVPFALPILGSEILSAARLQLDKIIVAALLGVEALGCYFFAFNAGIGLSLVLTTALAGSLFPELARQAADRDELLRCFDRAVRTTVIPIAGLLALQAVAAFVYVPLIFGERWGQAAPLVSLLCLSAVGKPYFDASLQLARAAGLPAADLKASMALAAINLAVLAAALALGVGLTAAVAAFALACLVTQLAGGILVRRHVGSEFPGSHGLLATPSARSSQRPQ